MAEPASEPPVPPKESPEAHRLSAAAELLASARVSATHGADDAADPFAGLEALAEPTREGEHMGPYRLERLLGRGGMGTVYAASRADGEFEQTVALKLLRLDRVAPDAQARFQRERAILARLQHPHIARLLDGGVTARGEAWFALELVSGQALVDYANERKLDLHARLALFLDTCEAVGYAHRNLVVHRDLKPSNILVDEDGQVKLLDFGIAKVIDIEGEVAGKPLTLADQRVLTPDYAAPEQILGEAITTATDIYALGLLLFELLTGSRAQRFQELSWAEAMQRAATTDPPPPSRAAAEAVAGSTIAAVTLRGDLDAIVLKALRREPERRYATVAEFAEDVRRYTEGYPVRARGDARSYRFGRFLRRHRIAVAAVGAVVLALAAGLAVALWQARAARLEAERANEVRTFIVGLFHSIDPDQARGREVSARELLDAGVARVQQELPRQPEVQVELLSTLGNLYLRLSQPKSATPLFEQALAVSRRNAAPGDPALAARLIDLAGARRAENRYTDAGVLLDEADRALARTGPESDAQRSRALALHTALGIRTDDLDSAERYARSAVALEERRVGRDHADYAIALASLCWVLTWKDQYAEAERWCRAAMAVPGWSARGPIEMGGRDAVLLVNVLGLRGRYREALELAEQNYQGVRARIGDESLATHSSRLGRARMWAQTGRLEEAEAEMRQVVAPLLAGNRGWSDNSFDGWTFGVLLVDRGKLREGLEFIRASHETMRERFGLDVKATLFVQRDLGAAQLALGDITAAERTLEDAAEGFRRRRGDQRLQIAEAQTRLSELRHAQARDDAAETEARSAVVTLTTTLGDEHDETGRAHHALGLALLERNAAGATVELKTALDTLEHLFGPDDVRVVEYRFDWGTALAAAGRPEADAVLRATASALARDELNEGATRRAAQAWLAAHGGKRKALSSISGNTLVTGARDFAQR